MLLVLPVPFRVRGDDLFLEMQALNGVNRWADHFQHVIVAAPVIPEAIAAATPLLVWKKAAELESPARVEFLRLPWAYRLPDFLRSYRETRAGLAALIARCEHLQFAIGGLVGDWAAVAAREANKQQRRFAIHTDRVEHEVLLELTKNSSFVKRLRISLIAGLMQKYHRRLIARCSLGLWHGSDCYDAYSPWCAESHLIHDVHTKAADCIDDLALEAKLENARAATLNICYAGRLDPMKAPLEWLKAIAVARDLNAPVQAVWFGDGPMRRDAEAEIQRLNLGGVVTLPGFQTDRARLLSSLRASHLMLFTHVTPESPRCLLEALISGTPILGYENKFAADLTRELGGGSFVPIHDWENLGRGIAELATDRTRLARLIGDAGRNGRRFHDDAVFAERSDLIKRFC